MPTSASSSSRFSLGALVAPLASLKLTVVLLALSMLLVYAGTGAQKVLSVFEVQKHFFHSFYVWIDLDTLILYSRHIPIHFPMPGGYTIGLLLLVNLLAAHLVRFKLGWNRIGVWFIHAGLILLLVGEGITSGTAIESQMVLPNGGSSNYAEDLHHVELAVVDPSDPTRDHVTTVSDQRLMNSTQVDDSRLPFTITVEAYYPNSRLLGPMQAAQWKPRPLQATAGDAGPVTAVEMPRIAGASAGEEEHDTPSAFITLHDGSRTLGTYLVSEFVGPQNVRTHDGIYRIELRQKRYYKPYTIVLKKFTHDVYTGTDVARNYASEFQLIDPWRHEDRTVKIWMNHPLRYNGETFYQESFLKNDAGSVLMVVSNPAWKLPYIACGMGALGMAIHFLMQLMKFADREPKRQAAALRARATALHSPSTSYTLEPRSRWTAARIVPLIAAVGCIVYVASLVPAPVPSGPDLRSFGAIPVSYEGRVQPLDSLARNSLKILSNHDSATGPDGKTHPAIEWLIDTFTQRDPWTDYKIFRIDYPDIISLLDLNAREHLFSIRELQPNLNKLGEQLNRLQDVDPANYDDYQAALADLGHKLNLYDTLRRMGSLHLVPPGRAGNTDWITLNAAMGDEANPDAPAPASRPLPASVSKLMDILAAYDQYRAPEATDAQKRACALDFNTRVGRYRQSLRDASPRLAAVMNRVDSEAFYNRLDPFLQCQVMYILAFLLAGISWLGWRPAGHAALAVVAVALALHTFGLADRIFITHRPPVTNLASSALYIGWGICLFCVGLELIYRNGIATALAALLGFSTLLISHQLSLDGDNMKVLQAVLDTNFWLATHVLCITLGYTTTFLAGFLAIAYLVIGMFTDELRDDNGKTVIRMIYGIVCFAMLFSFVGTILGGIWADQSWGRFWGWDPKENGAVLVVLCNAIILHARWGGLVKDRGFAMLAIFGNIVTAWSWFGTNMLGVGLHSYGFMPKAFIALVIFMALQAALIIVGAAVPRSAWRSFRAES